MIQLNYRDSKPIYEQIKDGIRRLIVSNTLAPDEKIPSVRELAASLAINPNTIQKAYHELEAEGYLYSLPGKGSFVAKRNEVLDAREKELISELDEVVTELMYLSVKPTELVTRVENLVKGGGQLDTGKQSKKEF